jgi:hypothetical protein
MANNISIKLLKDNNVMYIGGSPTLAHLAEHLTVVVYPNLFGVDIKG